MEYVLYALAVVVMSCLARAAGGGLGAHVLNKKGEVDDATGLDKGGIMPVNLSMLPEILFGVGLALPALLTGHWFLWLLLAVDGYAWMETGHGIAFHMGRWAAENWQNEAAAIAAGKPVRRQKLSVVMDIVERLTSIKRYSRAWCWVFMGLKGLLIGTACLPFGLLLAVLWPLAYDLGWTISERFPRFQPTKTEFAEYCSGAFAGVVLVLSLIFWL